MNKEEMSELEKRIDKRRIELLTEAVEIAEYTGTHEFVVEPMNDKMTILENLRKLKKIFRIEFNEAFEYKEENELRQIYVPTKITEKGGRLDKINEKDLKICPVCGERSLVLYTPLKMFCLKCGTCWGRIEYE